MFELCLILICAVLIIVANLLLNTESPNLTQFHKDLIESVIGISINLIGACLLCKLLYFLRDGLRDFLGYGVRVARNPNPVHLQVNGDAIRFLDDVEDF